MVAQEGSVTRAAARLHMSQPALSAKLRVLERELGSRLFVQQGHGVELSESGKLFLAYAEGALRLVEDGREAVRGTGSSRASLAIACVPSVSLSCLPNALGQFKREHPQVDVTVRSATSTAVFELLLARSVEVAIIAQGLNARGYERVALVKDPIVLVAASGHPLASRSEISLDELSGHHLCPRELGRGL
jgi:DNA-binding transcriptional LysR family regulator